MPRSGIRDVARFAGLIAVILYLSSILTRMSYAYVMPSMQVLEEMAKNFSAFKTLVIVQWAKSSGENNAQGEDLVEQRVWIAKRWQARCERSGSTGHNEGSEGGQAPCGWCGIERFEAMFLNHSTYETINFLSSLGVETSKVSLAHIGAKVVYVIGKRGKRDSYLMISRDKFLPIALRVWDIRSPSGPFTVRFDEYKQVGRGWYPHSIICETDLGRKEQYVIQEITPNVPIEASVFQPDKTHDIDLPATSPRQDVVDDRIKDVIRTLEEKYR
ncbi:MAG: hypothetical protein DRH12_01795 [Deltaproteobacteria bacterium]|nr:MAG: hypothetical protein DRH12_01795 [Deltaproteobacteria bacterium]